MSNIIFTTADGSAYKVLSARGLSQLPIWGGNRLIDMDHVRRIRESLNGNIKLLNLNPFRVGVIKQEDNSTRTEIIDGQHRAYILKEHFTSPEVEDFQVLVGGKSFNNEDEVILYFKILNNTRAIAWKDDPVMRANRYLQALMEEFNTDRRKPYIRTKTTTRPFISADKLREIMIAKKVVEWTQTPQEFVERVREINSQMVNGLRVKPSRRDMEDRAIEYNFALGLDDKFNWV